MYNSYVIPPIIVMVYSCIIILAVFRVNSRLGLFSLYVYYISSYNDMHDIVFVVLQHTKNYIMHAVVINWSPVRRPWQVTAGCYLGLVRSYVNVVWHACKRGKNPSIRFSSTSVIGERELSNKFGLYIVIKQAIVSLILILSLYTYAN